MKKLLYYLIIAAMVSCGKDKTTELTCKLSKSIHITSGYSDTTIYTYPGDDLIYTVNILTRRLCTPINT